MIPNVLSMVKTLPTLPTRKRRNYSIRSEFIDTFYLVSVSFVPTFPIRYVFGSTDSIVKFQGFGSIDIGFAGE